MVVVLWLRAWTLEPHGLLAAWPLATYFTFLGFSFSICKTGMKVVPAS